MMSGVPISLGIYLAGMLVTFLICRALEVLDIIKFDSVDAPPMSVAIFFWFLTLLVVGIIMVIAIIATLWSECHIGKAARSLDQMYTSFIRKLFRRNT